MARTLKAKGKCPCGQEVPLRRQDAPGVWCAHCQEVRRLFGLASWKAQEASRLYRAAPEVNVDNPSGPEGLLYLQASAAALEAAALVTQALAHGPRGYTPAQLRQWLAWARRRADWGAKLAANVVPLLEAARATYAHGLAALPGEAHAPAESRAVLRLLKLNPEENG